MAEACATINYSTLSAKSDTWGFPQASAISEPHITSSKSTLSESGVDLARPRGRACPLPWFHLLQHVNAKRDSIDSKTRQWKYYWLQNATRYVISKWCLLPCYQESIIDCKTRFDSFGRILGAGVPFACASNRRESELGDTQELALESRGLAQVRYFWFPHMWPVQEHIRRPESPVPIEYWVTHDL